MTDAAYRAAIAREDSKPCPRCGGDKLRPDFTGSGYCHAPMAAFNPPDQPVT